MSPVSPPPIPRSRRSRFLICMTVLIGASLVVVVFIGPLLVKAFPSLAERTDFFIHKEINEDNQRQQEFQMKNEQFQVQVHQVQNLPIDNPPMLSAQHPTNQQQTQDDQQQQPMENPPSHIFMPSVLEPLSAAEKLECPTSILSFVINATDTKDECEGLRKAFDKTCGGQQSRKKEKTDVGTRRRLSAFGSIDGSLYKDNKSKGLWWNPLRDYFNRRLDSLKHREVQDLHEQIGEFNPRHRAVQQNEVEDDNYVEEKAAPPISPSLPTSSLEVEESTLDQSLLLHQDLTEEEEDINNLGAEKHTNSAPNQKDNDASATEESKNSAVAVASVTNIPTVIETQVCCKSILKVFHEECDTPVEEEFNDKRLFVIVVVIALCGLVKSLIRHFKLRWLPEAGGCILVGMIGGFFLRFLPSMDFGFQHDMFLRLMVPPIVFEAALNINKKSFSDMAVPIVVFSVWGTFMSTILSAGMVYYGSKSISWCTTIPFIESLAFGSLISSIDPIAVLSVLNNMGMSDKDPIYVLIFGESLLNDGVAIVLFQTLIHFMDEKIVIDSEACWLATLHFLVIAFGSLFVGLLCGVAATVYFWLMKGIQTPLVEVLMFLCWAFIPYYICDGVDWSGIVAIVAAGFFMDIYVIGSRTEQEPIDSIGSVLIPENGHANMVPSRKRTGVFSQEGFLSAKAKNHIGFVTEINSTLMETAIFAYLGIFLLNKRYHWNVIIPVVAVVSCIASRSVMVVFSSAVSNAITRISSIGKKSLQGSCTGSRNAIPNGTNDRNNKTELVLIDARMQLVLIFSGLRGAMSFALVETVPMFDESTGEGSRYKPELKAMTSACIVFTVFILGGYTYYLLQHLGMGPSGKDEDGLEMVSLMSTPDGEEDEEIPRIGDTGIQKRLNRNLSSRIADNADL